jgi:tetratricopeptide (TPR) repeat protein
MQRVIITLALFLGFAATIAAQIGKNVAVTAGTDEDKALAAIYASPDGPDKVALIDKFMADFGKGDLELLGDQLYMQTYYAQKNYAKVYEYSEKVLTLDPNSLSAATSIAHAAEEQSDVNRLFSAGETAAAIVARYKTSPPPEGTDPQLWEATKENSLKGANADIGSVEYALVTASYKTKDPAARAALFERYVVAFPDSPYTENVREQTAVAYQQAQNTPAMLETAQSVLSKDPSNISMLLLLADYWSLNAQQLDMAGDYAQKALDILGQTLKPDNVADADWQRQVSLQKGLAYSALGEVDVDKNLNAKAVDAFKAASPLLKSDTFSYARNLYRLGFTLAKMRRIPEARPVLAEAASINGPYKARAQETLDKIGGAGAHHSGSNNP